MIDEEDEDWERTLRPVVLEPPNTRLVAHSRESSLEKLQSQGIAGLPNTATQSPSSAISPRLHTGAPRQAIGAVIERTVDPKAAAYAHNRQTSIVHGIQHSRNGSLASSSSSPLSPQMIAAAGGGALAPERDDMQSFARADADLGLGSRPSTTYSGATLASGPQIPDRISSATDVSSNTVVQRRPERMHSKTRRDHSHHQSHSSRHHKDEQKTVGEYALHVLFTSVSAFEKCIKVKR